MSIVTEITRIQGAKASLKTSIENKGVTIPSSAKIDDYHNYVDQIQQGGVENDFLTSTNLAYMFDHIDSQYLCDKYLALYNRIMQNYFWTLEGAFYADDVVYLSQFDLTKISGTSANLINTFQGIYNSDSNDVVLDFRNIAFGGANANNIFNTAGSSGGTIILKYNVDTFKSIISMMQGFQDSKMNLDLYSIDNIIDLSGSNSTSYVFNNFGGLFYNNGVLTEDINVKLKDRISLEGAFVIKNSQHKNINLINASNVTSFYGTFDAGSGYNQHFYSIKGIDLSNISSQNGLRIVNNSSTTSYNYTNLGEFSVVNGSTIGTNISYSTNLTLTLRRIWPYTANTVLNGQTVGYWYEKFANALGNHIASKGTRTIQLNSTLYNSLSQSQIAILTDKGYIVSSGT